MKKIKIIAVFLAILVALSVAICACGEKKNDNGDETTVAGGNAGDATTSKGNSNEGTTAGKQDNTVNKEETTLGGYVESEVITMVEITIEED